MLDEIAIRQKLYDLAAVFNVHMEAKRYHQAKRCYDTARLIVVFNSFDEKEKELLFGVRGNNGEIIIDGLFQEKLVQKAYYETCIKAKQLPADYILCQKQIKGVC